MFLQQKEESCFRKKLMDNLLYFLQEPMTNTPKKIIRWDMDGTTFDFPEKLAERLAKEKSLPEDVRRTLADVSNRTTDNIRELFPDTALQNHIEKTVKDIYQTEDFFLSLEPHP